MKAEIRLFANFRDFLPEGSKGFSYIMSFEGEKTVRDVMEAPDEA